MNAKQKQVVESAPEFWINPTGGMVPNAKGDRLSWEREVRLGVGDRAASMVAGLAPRVERLRQGVKLANARGENMVALERKKSLEVLEPELARWESLAKASAAWIGCAGKALDKAVAAAEAGEAAAEAPVQELEAARQVIVRLAAAGGVDAKEVDSAVAGIDKALKAKLTAARAALTSARTARDENAARIAELERELASLGRSAA